MSIAEIEAIEKHVNNIYKFLNELERDLLTKWNVDTLIKNELRGIDIQCDKVRDDYFDDLSK